MLKTLALRYGGPALIGAGAVAYFMGAHILDLRKDLGQAQSEIRILEKARDNLIKHYSTTLEASVNAPNSRVDLACRLHPKSCADRADPLPALEGVRPRAKPSSGQ